MREYLYDCMYTVETYLCFNPRLGERSTITHMLSHDAVKCVECQHLHMPNPIEDIYICLCTLKTITHEIDESPRCSDFEEIKSIWIPIYTLKHKNYKLCNYESTM